MRLNFDCVQDDAVFAVFAEIAVLDSVFGAEKPPRKNKQPQKPRKPQKP